MRSEQFRDLGGIDPEPELFGDVRDCTTGSCYLDRDAIREGCVSDPMSIAALMPKATPTRRPSVAPIRGLRSVFKDSRATPAQKLEAGRMLMILSGHLTPALNKAGRVNRSLQVLADELNADTNHQD